MATKRVRASELAARIGKPLHGCDCDVERAVPINKIGEGSMAFAKTFSDSLAMAINSSGGGFVIASKEFEGKLQSTHVLSDNPRLDFLRLVEDFFYESSGFSNASSDSTIESGAKIAADVKIGHRCYIGPDVVIGAGCEIHHNVVIMGRTSLGERCIVKSGCVIGEEGFGFEYDEDGIPRHFPHIGRIEIGNDVFIGANSTVERASIDVTMIRNDVKIDDLVQIGHNCDIGEGTLVMAGTILCGGVKIGKRCWIAPHTVVKQKLEIGDEAMTGLSSVVIGNIEQGVVVVGNPARVLRKK